MDYNDYLRHCMNCGHSKFCDLTSCPKKKVTDPLQNETKEQLIIFLHNSQYEIESLRNRLGKLTGCRDFGDPDGMDGMCIDCYYDNKELFDRCWKFKFPNDNSAAKKKTGRG